MLADRPYVTTAKIKQWGNKSDRVKTDAYPLSRLVAQSIEYQQLEPEQYPRFSLNLSRVDFKTLLTTAGTPGYAPDAVRDTTVVGYPQRRTYVSSLIRQNATRKSVIKYMRQVTQTLTTAAVAEGGTKPEAAFDWDEITSPLVKIPAFIPASREELEDVDGFEELIDQRLMGLLLIEEEDQILNGAGGTELTGIYNTSGVLTQSQGADTLADAIFKARKAVRITGRAEPNAVIIHPTDHETERLRKDSLGNYIYGPPTLPPPPYIWEMLAVVTDIAVVGQPIVGDFGYAHINRRTDGSFSMGDQHGSYFTQNKVAIMVEMRSSLELYRPSAFCYVTT